MSAEHPSDNPDCEDNPDCGDMSPLSTGRHVGQSESFDMSKQSADMSKQSGKPWAHAPPHWTHEPGIYFVTASTLDHLPLFKGPEMLDFLESTLWDCLKDGGWSLQAWAVFPNHYHFVASHGRDERALSKILGKVHMLTAKQANLRDETQGRKVWFNFWDTQLTFEKSWLARLAYVMENPVKHGLVLRPEQYRWCSAGWFSKNATRAFVKTVESFKTDRVAVNDPYIVNPSDCSDMSELSHWPTCRPVKSGDMSPQSESPPQSDNTPAS
jgi:putative transposase